MHSIFLSYCWQNADFADTIDTAFQPAGIILTRDIRNIKYKDSIKQYMEKIRSVDFVLILISDEFLKSANCMFEVLEVLKEKNFKEKILPVLVSGTRIFTAEDKLEYIRYWQLKYEELKNKLSGVETTSAIELYRELKHYQAISQSLDEFFAQVTDMNLTSTSDLLQSNFKPIFDYLGIDDQVFIQRILVVSRIKDLEERDIQLDLLEKIYPNTAQVAFVKGSLAFENNQTKKSSHFYRRAIELNPNFAPSYYNLAFNIETDGDINGAIEMYEKSIQIEPKNARALNNLARMYSREIKDYQKARELYEGALAINPNDADANYNLALLIHKQFDDYKLAESYYKTSIKLSPEAQTYLSLGQLLWKKLEKYKEAGDTLKAGLELESHNKHILDQLGELYEFGYKHYLIAKSYYDKAIKIDPTARDHRNYCTFLLHDSFGRKYLALSKGHYDMACTLDPSMKDEELEHHFFS